MAKGKGKAVGMKTPQKTTTKRSSITKTASGPPTKHFRLPTTHRYPRRSNRVSLSHVNLLRDVVNQSGRRATKIMTPSSPEDSIGTTGSLSTVSLQKAVLREDKWKMNKRFRGKKDHDAMGIVLTNVGALIKQVKEMNETVKTCVKKIKTVHSKSAHVRFECKMVDVITGVNDVMKMVSEMNVESTKMVKVLADLRDRDTKYWVDSVYVDSHGK